MIYRVVLDDTIDLHTSDINCMLLNPSLDLEMNSAGSFNFTLPPSHPYWDDIKVLKSTIDVYEDGDLIFTGRIASIEKNWNNERVVQCEGALAYFNDSIHRQMKWETPLPIASEDPTVHNFLKDILDNHNVFEGAENANRHIFIGNITIDPEVVTREVNYDTTLDILTRMCIDTNGGYMSVRKDLNDGKLYLDWIKDFTEESGQPAQFGLNLLNFDTSLAAEDICTGVLARGAEVNEQTVMLNNVELVDETTYPDMSVTHYTDKYQDVLWHREGVEKFGQVVQVHDFSDAQTAWKDGQGQIVANSLFEMAKKWLEEKNTKIETIEVEVAELAWLGEGMPKYKLGQIVELSDDVHMAGESYETRLLPMYKLSCDLNSGSKKVTLGTPPKKELTQISASNSDSSTLSSSGSSSGSGGGSGEGEECRVHDVRVDGTSVVTNKIANISLAGKADVSTVNALATTVAGKADTSTVNALATVVASKQNQIEFNTLEAATEVLTRLKADNKVYNLGGGTEVEANPSEMATDDLNTIKIGNTVYDIPGGGSNTNYGKFKCDVLFNTPTTTSAWANPIEICTEDKTKEYNMLYVVAHTTYVGQPSTFMIMVSEIGQYADSYLLPIPRTNSNVSSQEGYVWLSFESSKLKLYTDNKTITLDKVYGLKFENKLINRSDIYSEEERLIGRWTDGKPLYQKSYRYDNTSSQTVYVDVSSLNIDRLVLSNLSTGMGTPQNQVAGNWYMSGNDYGNCYLNTVSNNIEIRRGTDWEKTANGVMTIQYTKTTDTPDSGVIPEDPQFVMLSDIYSEEEQVVGRWTDGKPLYQKSGSIIYTANTPDWTLVENLDNYDYLVSSYGTYYEINGTNKDYIPQYGGRTLEPRLCVRKDHKLYHYFNSYPGNNRTFVYDYTIQYTKTTDAPGTGPTKGNLIYLPALYSEEEREVGVWTDGKPLYQKVVTIASLPNSTTVDYQHNIANVDHIFITGGIAENSQTGLSGQLNYPGSEGQWQWNAIVDKSIIRVWAGRDRTSFNYVKVILNYTKTTDQPGSGTWTPEGQLAHHYSTSEKIVGTWIDGSTVYERTWDFSASPITMTNNSWTDLPILKSGFNYILRAEGTYGKTSKTVQVDANSSTQYLTILTDRATSETIAYLTLQYTKTS